MMNYPLADIALSDQKDMPNIIFITVDSWRYDLMDAEVTPNIHSFSKDAWVFNNHYSGGNSTRFGMFSMFYGIYGSYWHTILAERTEPVLMQKLRERITISVFGRALILAGQNFVKQPSLVRPIKFMIASQGMVPKKEI